MFSRFLSLLGLFGLVPVSEAKNQATPFTAISKSSISASWPTNITLTGTAIGGAKADFFPSCTGVEPKTLLTPGQDQATTFVVNVIARDLKLCYQAPSSATQEEVHGVSLDVVEATSPEQIKSTDSSIAIVSKEFEITLEGGQKGAKAIFIPVADACKSKNPREVLDSTGKTIFKIGSPGAYKLCYQAPGGTDSVEQVNADLSYPIRLQVVKHVATSPKLITSISPHILTANIPAMIQFEGATEGDKGAWVHSGALGCQDIEPTLDMTAGHRTFTITTTGTYKLCYRASSALDSVLQEAITLTVIPPGVIGGDMINRWTEKAGNVDCSTLTLVPHCGQALEATCTKSFMIDDGRGYHCQWNTTAWPPECQGDTSTTDADQVCTKNTCGGQGTSRCWGTLRLED